MKSFLSSVDVRVLCRELSGLLVGCRFDKAYSLENEGIRIRFHASGFGGRDLVVYPNFACVSSFSFPQLEGSNNFVMVLRKFLEGLAVKFVRQHAFDRILEIGFEGNRGSFLLIVELFSKGNVVLCDESGKILGLSSRQKWKDRILKTGNQYLYPPETLNPLEVNSEKFKTLLRNSDRNLVTTLASMGLGGFYAEEICLQANFEKTIPASNMGVEESEKLYDIFEKIMNLIENGKVKPAVILNENGSFVDVVAFESQSYRSNEKKSFNSFNEAVDEFFSRLQSGLIKTDLQKGFSKESGKLQVMLEKQEEALQRQQDESVKFRLAGDLIYQNRELVERIVEQVEKARKQGLSDKEINERFAVGKSKNIPEAIVFKKLDKTKLTLDLD